MSVYDYLVILTLILGLLFAFIAGYMFYYNIEYYGWIFVLLALADGVIMAEMMDKSS
jgi:hypothetical protein